MHILTAASSAYADSLLAFLGSLRCNWPDHPPVIVHDLGLAAETRRRLELDRVEVKPVPEFCPHWRRHFVWKIWACHAYAGEAFLWLDAGIAVLRPAPEIFDSIRKIGYFFVPNGLQLGPHTTPLLIENLRLRPQWICTLPSMTGGIFGFSNGDPRSRAILDRALELAHCEDNVRSTAPRQFHDQSLLSVLAHQQASPLLWADRVMYGLDQGGIVSPHQRFWCHRRTLRREDLEYYVRCLTGPAEPHLPTPPAAPKPPSPLLRLRVSIARWRGRLPSPPPAKACYDGVRD